MRKSITGFFLFMVLSAPVFSSGLISNAKVNDVRVDRDGKAIVTFDQVRSSEPASCGNTYSSSFSIDTSSEGGKAILSIALSALATGKDVVVWGTGSCLDYPSHVESWNYGHIYREPQI